MQRIEIHRFGRRRSAAEGFGRVLQKLPPPLGDLVGMQLELLGQLGQRLVFPQSRHGHLRLERRRVRAAGAPR